MSCHSSQTTVQNPKEPGDTSALDPTDQPAKESATNPSVQQQEEIVNDLLTPDKLDSEEKRQRTLSQKAIHNAIQTSSTELNKQGKALRLASDNVYSALEKNASHKDMETFLEPLQQAYIKYEEMLVI